MFYLSLNEADLFFRISSIKRGIPLFDIRPRNFDGEFGWAASVTFYRCLRSAPLGQKPNLEHRANADLTGGFSMAASSETSLAIL